MLAVLLPVLAGSYLIGAIPFGYLVARMRGVDILSQGSKNIGATNVGRVLGRNWGILVFFLDFLKGGVPVLIALLLPQPENLLPGTQPVLAGVAAFLGHLYPVYLGFRGGKGVATGAGIAAVLDPVGIGISLAVWAILLFLTRYMSIASLASCALMVVLRLTLTVDPFGRDHRVITVFILIAVALIFVRHQGNIRRLLAGTEHRL